MEKTEYNEEVHDHCTHQKSDLHIQFCINTLFKNSSANMVIKLYNQLPNTIKILEKIQEFKGKLKYLFIIINCSTTHGGPWPSSEALPIRLCPE
jgi:hypothetical protein